MNPFQLSHRLIERLRIAQIRRRFRVAADGILATPPLAPGRRPFVALSMVQHTDIAAYLVAIKSFAYFMQPRQIVVVCDPTITPDDKYLLGQHLPNAIFNSVAEFRHPQLPVDGCWERLQAVAHYAKTNFVVQLDADTVTLAPLLEVAEAIEQRQGFVLNGFLPGDDDDDEPAKDLASLAQASHYALRWSPRHIQALAEQQLVHAGLTEPHYVRGCAGFTGFPAEPALLDRTIDFSTRMQHQLGTRWSEWGTEQITSNYLVANAAGTRLLPMPQYSAPGPSLDDHAFVHFIGSTRFINRNYEMAAKRVINMISPPPVEAT